MDFELTEEEKSFQQQVRAFLDKEVTEGVIEESKAGLGFGEYSWELMRKLGAKGWLAPTFPVEFGGLGLPRTYRYIVQRELDYRNALVVIRGLGLVGVDMAGPVILRNGSEELKREFLPRVARGEIEFALGYSEPNAGSDLSEIAIRAVEDGDDFVITGQKIFNTGCHFSQYHWLAARTGPDVPSHKGISLFIIDLKSPGITISPLWEMSDTRTNEVFYDEVRVSKRYLVGKKDMGWYYMVEALDLERLITVGGVERTFDELVTYAKKTLRNGIPLSKDPLVRQKLADLAIEISIARNFIRQVVWLQSKGEVPTWESAVLKLFNCDLYQKISRVALELLDVYGQLKKNSKYSVLQGDMERFFRSTFVMTIGGGSSEIMRNIIATKGLRLPR
jgi:alkylation response protein AidB-like acyl-CoA dehydrogenase